MRDHLDLPANGALAVATPGERTAPDPYAAAGTRMAAGLSCAVPVPGGDRVTLGHGSGGKLSAALVRDRFLPHFADPTLAALGDAAVLPLGDAAGTTIAMTTDAFVVSPLEFPGGDIGTLAVHGTVNDLAMMGARPLWLTAAFVLEEGLELAVVERIAASMGAAARAAGVALVAGDTKVVERGKGDGMFVTTTGVGLVGDFRPAPHRATPGDVVIATGPIGRHGMTILSLRDGLGFEGELASDSAALWPLVEALRDATDGDVHALRDATRGGVASTVNEIAHASRVGIVLDEGAIPVPPAVAGACEMLGLDPLYVANEGVAIAFLPAARADAALAALRVHPLGRDACVIGRVVAEHPGMVVLRTPIGGTRVVDLLPGDQLPRIC